MYGKGDTGFPQRIVCLSAEHVEICYALGAGDRVVAVPGTAHRPPEAREKPRIGGFTTFRADRIRELEPDLVLAFSDLQADISAELIRAGLPVFCSNPRSIEEILGSILLVGGLLGLDKPARDLVQDMRDEIRQLREFSSVWPDRPRVYFEEWHDPLIAGIRWVSEIIELAGGRDIFSDLRDKRSAKERVLDPDEVVRRDPQIILASWCGKPVDIGVIRGRPGWSVISAVKTGRIHEVDGADILSPGPSVMAGLRTIHEIVQQGLDR
ncbi:MAG TPA: ABC transporter substrate-binding protein [Methylomirabilota bacterium]|jgi:iron complex transport system substrate-binding protein|nr:ABC transporter substrate-binding protein [Methylomirabilota bacterium]